MYVCIDPQDTRPWGVNQKYYMECSADAGYFTIFIMGSYTPPIPYDADPGLLKHLLEQNERVCARAKDIYIHIQ